MQKTIRADELGRYDPNGKSYPWFEMEKCNEGDYVRYDQAAEIIAAKDKEIERLREKLRQEFQLGLTTLERAEVAEAKNRELNTYLETAVHNARKYADDCVYLEAGLTQMEKQWVVE